MADPKLNNQPRLDFVIIGAMKSGSTTLYEYLCRHPSIFMPVRKEPMFFSRDHVYSKGFDWYESLFQDAKNDQICGEASTCYTRQVAYPLAAQRLMWYRPNVKLIYILRHPVQRALSHYKHEMEARLSLNNEKPIAFQEALKCIPEIVDASMYFRQIEKYLAFFAKEQLKCIFFEDLIANPDMVLNEVQQFLDVKLTNLRIEENLVANPSGSILHQKRSRQITDKIRSALLFSTAIDLLPVGFRRKTRNYLEKSKLMKLILKNQADKFKEDLTPIDEQARLYLLDIFKEENKKLEAFLGNQLNHWNK